MVNWKFDLEKNILAVAFCAGLLLSSLNKICCHCFVYMFTCPCRSDLATVQEQYVALCREKEKLSTKLEEVERENMSSVQAALDKVGMV